MNKLNPPQKQAVEHTGQPLLVLAGAGSGKTRVITQKIAWLIHDRGVNPTDITALTFTNKAAREMKQRVSDDSTDPESIKGLTVSTFHSLGMQILRRECRLAGLRPGFSIIDPRDAVNIVADLLRADLTTGRELVERTYQRISAWKNLGLTPERVIADGSDPISKTAASIYQSYQRYLLACNSVDLDDLILTPLQLIRNEAEVKERWQQKIQYLLVDEYQDTNCVQYELIKMLARKGHRLTVVGDDDQSIYAWRGAQPGNLLQLSKDYPDLRVIKLEQNYRSSGRILKVANHLIKNNPRPFEKSLWSDLGYGDPISIFQAKNEEHEAEKVVSSILRHQFQHGSRHGDFAILYRSNHQARIMEIKLREMRIPYKLSGGYSFFDRSEIRDIMAYLRLLTNPSDDSAFLRIINIPRRGLGATSLEKLGALAQQHSQSLFETLFHHQLSDHIKARQTGVLRQFGQMMTEIADRTQRGGAIDAIRTLLDEIHFKKWLEETGKDDAAEKRWENVLTLVEWIENAGLHSDGNPSLTDIINELILSDMLDREQEDQDQNRVNLMTLHAAKGLEFKHAYIIGVEEEILPHRVSIAEDSCEEERRLFYVGITRAMESLTLSYTRQRKRFGDLIDCTPSRFIDELPQDELDWVKLEDPNESERQDTGRAHLASIRAARARPSA